MNLFLPLRSYPECLLRCCECLKRRNAVGARHWCLLRPYRAAIMRPPCAIPTERIRSRQIAVCHVMLDPSEPSRDLLRCAHALAVDFHRLGGNAALINHRSDRWRLQDATSKHIKRRWARWSYRRLQKQRRCKHGGVHHNRLCFLSIRCLDEHDRSGLKLRLGFWPFVDRADSDAAAIIPTSDKAEA